MFLPYKVDVPMVRIPWTNWVLIAVTCIVSISTFVKELQEGSLVRRQLSPETVKRLKELQDKGDLKAAEELFIKEIGGVDDDFDDSAFPGALDPHRFAFSQLITYQFVHGDIIHLLGNMFFLFVFGNAVNAKIGHVPFVASYLFLGVLSGLGWMALGNGEPVVGASGSIMGIIGIFFMLYPRNDVTVLYGAYGGGGSFEMPAFWLIIFYMLADLYGLMRAGQQIAYVAHLAGAVCGAGLALAFIMTGFVKSTRYEQNLLEALGLGDPEPGSKKKRKKKRRVVQQLPTDD